MKRWLLALLFAGLATVVVFADYSYVNSSADATGDTDPGDLVLTGVTSGNLLVACAATTTGADAPAFSSSPSNTWITPVTTLWINTLRRVTMSAVLSAASGDTTLTVDIPGGDTAAYDAIVLAEYSDSGGFASHLDSDSAFTEDGDDTSVVTPSMTGDTSGAAFISCVHTLVDSAMTGGTTRQAVGFSNNVEFADKRSTNATDTAEWTWTGDSWAGVVAMSFQETAGGGSCVPCALANTPLRGGGLPLLLVMTQHPFGPRLVQQKRWVRR